MYTSLFYLLTTPVDNVHNFVYNFIENVEKPHNDAVFLCEYFIHLMLIREFSKYFAKSRGYN
ncbi:hypothetical protein GCM10023310_61790 [Paenibacillus vulneris]